MLTQSNGEKYASEEARVPQTTLQPSVSVIIVHYSGFEMLHKCLESIFNTRYNNFQVVLVDNGSKDGSIDFVKRAFGDHLDVIRSDVNLGFVGGNNLALQRVKSKYLVLLNDDTVVDPDWLRHLVDVVESDPHIGACQPKLLSLANPRYFEYNGCAGGMIDVYGVPFCRGRVFDVIEEDEGQYNTIREVFWAGGAAILIKQEVLGKTGFLDAMFYAHMEEIDLCWRMRLVGYTIVSVPRAVVYHSGGSTSLAKKFYLKQRNNLVMMLKNYDSRSLMRFFTMRICLDALSFVYFLIKRDQNRSFCILKAYIWLLSNLKNICTGRYNVQKRRRVSDEEILRAMVGKSVAIQHYVLKRKNFSQLRGLPLYQNHYLNSYISRFDKSK